MSGQTPDTVFKIEAQTAHRVRELVRVPSFPLAKCLRACIFTAIRCRAYYLNNLADAQSSPR